MPSATMAPSPLKLLYDEAFRLYRGHALWNLRQTEDPATADALIVARQLRIEGDRDARRLAERIEATVVILQPDYAPS